MTNFLVNTKSLVVIVFLFSLNSFAGPCATALSDFPLERIDYVGIKFSGPATCIEAKYEKDARSRCSGLLINPANPQYSDSSDHAALFGPEGTIDVNPRGFFYCIPKGVGFNKTKASLCNDKTIHDHSDWENDIKRKYTFRFDKKASGSTDGDCMCKELNTTAAYRRCNREPPAPADRCAPQGLALAKYEEYENLPDNGNLTCVSQVCKCPEGSPIKFFPAEVAKESCAKKEALKPPTPTPAAVAKPPVVAAATQPDSNLKKCVDDWKTEALKCKQEADDAKKNCGAAKTTSKEDKENTAAINAATGLYTAPKAGSGMQQECFTAGLVATGAKSLLGPKSDVCAANVESCKSTCSEENINNLRNACAAKINTAEQPAYDDSSTPNQNYFEEGDKFVREITEEAGKVCNVDATKGQSELSSILSGVGNALAQSMKCMCQTSSGAGDCAALPTPGACDLNPALAGCGGYSSLTVCTPGANYDAKSCSCQLNPKEAGCPGGAASGGLSNFASPSIKSNGINDGGGTPTIAGGLKATGAFPDLPRGTNDDGSSGGTPMTLGASPSSGPGGGVGGGMGGGGGASGGGEPPAAAAEAAAEEKGIGGLFNQAKTFFKDALGGKKTPSTAAKNGKSEKGFDPNKLRPTRGLASKNGIGSKNQDIWKMSNACMYAETCPRNMNSFLEAPLKQK